jgi:hypothetical protein
MIRQSWRRSITPWVCSLFLSCATGACALSPDLNIQVYTDAAPALPNAIIPRPTIKNRYRSSEAYFVLWSLTSAGRAKVQYWTSLFPSLRYQRRFTKFEVQHFLRELLTVGTKLNKVAMGGLECNPTTMVMLAVVFLTSKTRRRSERAAYTTVQRLFGAEWTWAKGKTVQREIAVIMQHEDSYFNNNFMTVHCSEQGEPVFFMAIGQENKLLKDRWYDLGQVGCFDIAESVPAF